MIDVNILQIHIAFDGVAIPFEHRIDCFGKLSAVRFVDTAGVDPNV